MFYILAVASALSLEPSVTAEMPSTMPDIISNALVESEGFLAFVSGCAESRSNLKFDKEIYAANMRQFDLRQRAISMWGGGERLTYKLAFVTSSRGRCARKEVQKALAEMNATMSDLDKNLLSYERQISIGAWLGPIRLCRKTVTSVVKGVDDFRQTPILLFEMTDDGAAQLAAFTKQAISDEVAIRIDGTVVSRPRVHEPALSGKFQVSTPQTELYFESVRQVSTAPC
ncbi:hypothetical protein [Novosphingobium sp.]|uniref:SecDF P1 head subdomain-containing protein n=1 Tax=Novosphingobium sp. TaxID=1874826 RepID=UPI002625A2F3|nr:hypothetical protein [Novosphingobium sp.]